MQWLRQQSTKLSTISDAFISAVAPQADEGLTTESSDRLSVPVLGFRQETTAELLYAGESACEDNRSRSAFNLDTQPVEIDVSASEEEEPYGFELDDTWHFSSEDHVRDHERSSSAPISRSARVVALTRRSSLLSVTPRSLCPPRRHRRLSLGDEPLWLTANSPSYRSSDTSKMKTHNAASTSSRLYTSASAGSVASSQTVNGGSKLTTATTSIVDSGIVLESTSSTLTSVALIGGDTGVSKAPRPGENQVAHNVPKREGLNAVWRKESILVLNLARSRSPLPTVSAPQQPSAAPTHVLPPQARFTPHSTVLNNRLQAAGAKYLENSRLDSEFLNLGTVQCVTVKSPRLRTRSINSLFEQKCSSKKTSMNGMKRIRLRRTLSFSHHKTLLAAGDRCTREHSFNRTSFTKSPKVAGHVPAMSGRISQVPRLPVATHAVHTSSSSNISSRNGVLSQGSLAKFSDQSVKALAVESPSIAKCIDASPKKQSSVSSLSTDSSNQADKSYGTSDPARSFQYGKSESCSDGVDNEVKPPPVANLANEENNTSKVVNGELMQHTDPVIRPSYFKGHVEAISLLSVRQKPLQHAQQSQHGHGAPTNEILKKLPKAKAIAHSLHNDACGAAHATNGSSCGESASENQREKKEVSVQSAQQYVRSLSQHSHDVTVNQSAHDSVSSTSHLVTKGLTTRAFPKKPSSTPQHCKFPQSSINTPKGPLVQNASSTSPNSTNILQSRTPSEAHSSLPQREKSRGKVTHPSVGTPPLIPELPSDSISKQLEMVAKQQPTNNTASFDLSFSVPSRSVDQQHTHEVRCGHTKKSLKKVSFSTPLAMSIREEKHEHKQQSPARNTNVQQLSTRVFAATCEVQESKSPGTQQQDLEPANSSFPSKRTQAATPISMASPPLIILRSNASVQPSSSISGVPNCRETTDPETNRIPQLTSPSTSSESASTSDTKKLSVRPSGWLDQTLLKVIRANSHVSPFTLKKLACEKLAAFAADLPRTDGITQPSFVPSVTNETLNHNSVLLAQTLPASQHSVSSSSNRHTHKLAMATEPAVENTFSAPNRNTAPVNSRSSHSSPYRRNNRSLICNAFSPDIFLQNKQRPAKKLKRHRAATRCSHGPLCACSHPVNFSPDELCGRAVCMRTEAHDEGACGGLLHTCMEYSLKRYSMSVAHLTTSQKCGGDHCQRLHDINSHRLTDFVARAQC